MFKTLVWLLLLLVSGVTVAAGPTAAKLEKALAAILPGVSLNEVKASPIPGLYEVVAGGEVFYATADGSYLVTGDLIDVNEQENLTETKRGAIRLGLINAVGEERMIIFEPKDPKRTITVFTDVDCRFCQKFHLDVPKLVKSGIRVRYLLYPRNGIDSETYEKSVAVWCADDRKKAIGIAKAKGKLGKLEPRTCPNPVADHYRLARRIGVRGTPTIVLDTGKMLTGYVPPAKLLALLNLGASVAKQSAKP